MNCHEAQPHLATHADGELRGALRSEIEQHVGACEPCRTAVRDWQRLRAAANRVLYAGACPAALRAEIAARCRPSPRVARRAAPQRLVWALGGLAAGLVLLAIYNIAPDYFDRARAPVVNTAARAGGALGLDPAQFASIYQQCATAGRHDGLRVRGEPLARVRNTVAAQARFAVFLPDLSAHGFVLDGACTCLKLKHARTVHAFYRRDTLPPETLSIFSISHDVDFGRCHKSGCRTRSKPRRSYEVVTSESVTVLGWNEYGCGYVVCGEMDAQRLTELVDHIDVADLRAPRDARVARP
jgi:anti-sigma factor RsiW